MSQRVYEKAYMIIRMTSNQATKPVVLTGFDMFSIKPTKKTVKDAPNTTFVTLEGGGVLYDSNVTQFRTKAGLLETSDSLQANQKIKVISYGQIRYTLVEELKEYVEQELQVAAGNDNEGQITCEWSGGVVGEGSAHWTAENGDYVWWEVVDVDVAYERLDMDD
jgi:hypothetical protein